MADSDHPINTRADLNDPSHRGILARIHRFVWDCDDKGPQEVKFVAKLDGFLLTIMCLSYFVRYLDQANINNAYVSGMKESLDIKGDEYNLILSCYMIGYVVGQFPGTILMAHISPSIWLPVMEICWTAFVFGCGWAKNVQTIMVFRFFVGLFESSHYPGGLYVLSSFYGPSELGKRAVIFQATSSIGTMFSGYLQAAVYNNLDGKGGLQGWQWLMVIDGIISLPIAFIGFFVIPDTPTRPNPRAKWWFGEKEQEWARLRMERVKRVPPAKFTVKAFKKAFSAWQLYAFFLPYTCFVLSLSSYLYMNLWLKAAGYSVVSVNTIPTGGYGLQLATSFIFSWISDFYKVRWSVIAIAGIPALFGNIVLAAWPSSLSLKFVAFYCNFSIVSLGALTLAWASELVGMKSAEHRAIILGFLNTAAYVFNAWIPNLLFPASKAPVYPSGYKVTSVFIFIFLTTICAIRLFINYSDKAVVSSREELTDDDIIDTKEEARE